MLIALKSESAIEPIFLHSKKTLLGSDIFETVVEYYSIVDEDDEESEVKEETIAIVLTSKALETLDIIKLWNLQQADTNGNDT